MSLQVSAVAAPAAKNHVMPEINRRSANFNPAFEETDVIMRQQIEELKENVIQAILQQLQKTHESDDPEYTDDLYTVALLFRLLRQDGYYVSCDMFNKFKDSKGNFKGSLCNDVKGILSLYEATHLRVKGEDILDEALVFTTTHLQSVASQLSGPPAAQVTHALKQPIRKGLPRLEARHYFSVYQEDASHDKVILKFAKLDFNLLQKVHQKELSDIARSVIKLHLRVLASTVSKLACSASLHS